MPDSVSHHHGRRFRNIWDMPAEMRLWPAIKWMLKRTVTSKHNIAAPVVRTHLELLRTPAENLRITWIGHSSFLVQKEAMNILIDPVFAARVSPLPFLGPRRFPELPFALEDLPKIHLVVISHDHYDHLDRHVVSRLAERDNPMFLVPLGVERIVRSFGAKRVAELDWWRETSIDGVSVHCLPAMHFSGRGVHNRNGTLWASWYLDLAGTRLFYAGDSGYAHHFADIARIHGPPDVAIIPVGAYLPRWMMAPVHVSPEEALQVFLDLGASVFIPCHWGTFDLADEPLQEPMERLERAAIDHNLTDRIVRMAIGETRVPYARDQEALTLSPSS